jgi:methylated-DNA-protein-cysteine methyltransferase-like protein
MVGYAMNLAHSVIPSVPAHRVVNRNGLLTGKMHFNPPEAMEQRLQVEGIIVRDDAIQDWANVFWDPSENLRL